MAQFQRHFVQDLTKPLIVRQCGDLGFSGDNLSDVISVDLYTDGEAYSGGGTCAGACICPDGSTVALSGSVSGKTASVTLTEDCFAIPGQIGVAIRVTSGTTKTTVLKAIYNVEPFSTNNPVDPGSRIALDVGDLINRIDAAIESIPASADQLKAAMAPNFSATTAYPAGAYVWNNGTLYKFTTAHAAGSWTGTDATAVALGNDVADLRSATSGVLVSTSNNMSFVGLSYLPMALELGSINLITGKNAVSTDGTRMRSTYVPVKAGGKCRLILQTSATLTTAHMVKYDADYNVVGNAVTLTTDVSQNINIAQGVSYVRFRFGGTGLSTDNTTAKFYTRKSILTSADSLNDITEPGIYVYESESVPTFAPVSDASCRIINVHSQNIFSNDAWVQIGVASTGVFVRKYADSAFSEWEKILSGDMFAIKNLGANDDLNNVQNSGIYSYVAATKPANAPNYDEMGRVLVVKSVTGSNHTGEWQLVHVKNVGLFFRNFITTVFGGWTKILSADDISVAGLITTRGTINSGNDLDTIPNPGVNYYIASNRPKNAPSASGNARVLTIKSATEDAFGAYSQIAIINGVLYYRDKPTASAEMNNWRSVGLGSPVYQTEVLPYNAVLYHQKWDELIQDTENIHLLRRINLGNVDNDSSLPMYAYEFCPQRNSVETLNGGGSPVLFDWTNPAYARPKILILGGVHGNEKCTPMDIYTIVKLLKRRENNDIACKFDWYFIPLLNPWGYSHARLDADGNIMYDNTGTEAQIVSCSETINAGIRNNAHGQNINRDWSDVVFTSGGVSYGFQTPELQLIKDYVLDIAPDVMIDTHQNHANRTEVTLSAVCCTTGSAIDPDNSDQDYAKLKAKIYRQIDIANADVDRIMYQYCAPSSAQIQSCRVWPSLPETTANMYFGGVTSDQGGVTVGNTEHQSIKTPYTYTTETSEIAATYAKQGDTWYTPVACTFSTTYLWHVIKRMAEMF